MADYSGHYEGKALDGRPWFTPRGEVYSTSDRPRGCVAIREDNRVRFYRVSRRERGAFKNWAAAIYSGMSCNRLVGRWPSYEVWPPQ